MDNLQNAAALVFAVAGAPVLLSGAYWIAQAAWNANADSSLNRKIKVANQGTNLRAVA